MVGAENVTGIPAVPQTGPVGDSLALGGNAVLPLTFKGYLRSVNSARSPSKVTAVSSRLRAGHTCLHGMLIARSADQRCTERKCHAPSCSETIPAIVSAAPESGPLTANIHRLLGWVRFVVFLFRGCFLLQTFLFGRRFCQWRLSSGRLEVSNAGCLARHRHRPLQHRIKHRGAAATD